MPVPDAHPKSDNTQTPAETAVLAGGCFWCLEAVYPRVRGVGAVKSGYTGGHVANPGYEQVCRGSTGHAEAVRVDFNPSVVSFGDLLDIFFTIHDPTTLNRQGADVGTQYRSAVFWTTAGQRDQARRKIREIEAAGIWENPIVTQIEELGEWYPAEAYHDDYLALNPRQPYCAAVVAPKVAKFRQRHRHLLKRGA